MLKDINEKLYRKRKNHNLMKFIFRKRFKIKVCYKNALRLYYPRLGFEYTERGRIIAAIFTATEL